MINVSDDRIEGIRLALRLARPEDAAYVHGLRMDRAYNTHLSAVTGTIADQEAWLRKYKAREAAGEEYYYVIERLSDATPCGLVRLYDFDGDQFTWGSWILDHNKPRKAALESAVLIYVRGFEQLGMVRSVFDVRLENTHTQEFHRRFGAVETGRDTQDVFFEYPRTRFLQDKESHLRVLGAAQAGPGSG